MTEDKAPIVLFVYNRPWHTQQTIEALQRNKLASESELFIYSDAPKNEGVKPQVQQVRDYIKNVSGFKRVTIIKRDRNWGLAASIIDGVTEIVNRYGRIIVLEDDLVTSPYFLVFMNDALEFYCNERKVWHISGWNYPIAEVGLDDTFLWKVMSCWGWGTWKDRWQFFEKQPASLINNWNKETIIKFNLDGVYNFWSQVEMNYNGKIETWAVFWYATIFQKNGLCLSPVKTYVKNIGIDGTGENCGSLDFYSTDSLNLHSLYLPSNIVESSLAVSKIKDFYKKTKPSFLTRILSKIKRIFLNTLFSN